MYVMKRQKRLRTTDGAVPPFSAEQKLRMRCRVARNSSNNSGDSFDRSLNPSLSYTENFAPLGTNQSQTTPSLHPLPTSAPPNPPKSAPSKACKSLLAVQPLQFPLSKSPIVSANSKTPPAIIFEGVPASYRQPDIAQEILKTFPEIY
ncbi:uncharacterized protein LOC143250524 [Tachypleus tridentatus]|uniref:uncharacterized protein LOC143250524 n=1 Tax=Tachypleus tridentatus TaxID=6853 RepID=UPI003FD483FC